MMCCKVNLINKACLQRLWSFHPLRCLHGVLNVQRSIKYCIIFNHSEKVIITLTLYVLKHTASLAFSFPEAHFLADINRERYIALDFIIH